jgi:uncharacterized protein YndB with AHSA1/START domain
MSYELRIQRLFDAPPELVFDTFVDPNAQADIYADAPEGYRLLESEIDLRVGGTWTTTVGPEEGEPDRLTYVFTEIDRPRRLVADMNMFVGEWGRTVASTVALTFEEHEGKTLVTIVQSGFETEEDRDSFMSGAPGFLDALQRAVAARVAGTETDDEGE